MKICQAVPTSENMTDIAVHVEAQLAPDSAPQQVQASVELQLQEDVAGEEAATETWINGELEGFMEQLAGGDAAPPCGEVAARDSQQVRLMDESLRSIQMQLRFLLGKADDLHSRLVHGRTRLENEGSAAKLRTFLYTCQPYFTYLESTARSTVPQHPPLPTYIRSRLLHFSQQLRDRLEQLVLTYANYNVLCLDETEPDSMSHFYVGQCQLGRVRLTAFRYCKPAPYAARADTGLYKRMRWNVERPRDERRQQADEEERHRETETAVVDTEYYFLCYEEAPEVQTEPGGEGQGVASGNAARMWYIGQWIQVNPDPDAEDIYDWILCEVPQAKYLKLSCLGSEEPSACSATDHLMGLLLLSQYTPE